jgi:hypothetical protein
LEARRALGGRNRLPAAGSLLACVALASCGGGERQDEDEPEGRFPVEVVEARFPAEQQLAKTSKLAITVRNAGDRTIPNVGVTLNGLGRRKDDPDLSDPTRPIFVINGKPREIGGLPESQEESPAGCDTAYVNTWACGRLRPGQERTFEWTVTAVQAGPYRISYRVNAGLDGKAKAVDADGGSPRGRFTGSISDVPPQTRVADDGKTIVRGTR